MKQKSKNHIDCLEIAFERNSAVEQIFTGEPTGHYLSAEEAAEEWERSFDPARFAKAMESIAESEPEPVRVITEYKGWHIAEDKSPYTNSPYKYNFKVSKVDILADTCHEFGYIYFETYLLQRDYIYLRVDNKQLYYYDLWKAIDKFMADFDLHLAYVSKLDIAIDSEIDTSKIIFSLMKRRKDITWILNGRKIQDRDKTIKQLFWVTSGSLNSPDANKTLYVTQKEGLKMVCYDKRQEIVDKDCRKFYQRYEEYESSDGLLGLVESANYRNEIRLNRKNIVTYMESHGLSDKQLFKLIRSEASRGLIFMTLSGAMLRWWDNGEIMSAYSLITGQKWERHISLTDIG